MHDQDGKAIFIPIDGKTMRGSYTNADKSDILHLVSAWTTQQGITLGQVAVDSKLTSLGHIFREVGHDGRVTIETSYYICSIDAKVGVFSESARMPGPDLSDRVCPGLGV